jgi:hypothetical protein
MYTNGQACQRGRISEFSRIKDLKGEERQFRVHDAYPSPVHYGSLLQNAKRSVSIFQNGKSAWRFSFSGIRENEQARIWKKFQENDKVACHHEESKHSRRSNDYQGRRT